MLFALVKESTIESTNPKHILLVLSGISGGGVLIKFNGKKSFSVISLCTHRKASLSTGRKLSADNLETSPDRIDI